MIPLSANLDQLDEIRRRLHAKIILTDSGKWIFDDYLCQRVQSRLATGRDGDLCFEEKIESPGKWSLGTASAFGDGLDAAERLRAPGDNQAGVAKVSLPQKNGSGALHILWLAQVPLRREADQPGSLGRSSCDGA